MDHTIQAQEVDPNMAKSQDSLREGGSDSGTNRCLIASDVAAVTMARS